MYDIKSIYNPQLGEYYVGVHAFVRQRLLRHGCALWHCGGHGATAWCTRASCSTGTYQYYQFTISNQDAPFTSKTLTFTLATMPGNRRRP